MNYEERYKQAIETAKRELHCCGSLDCDAARQVFRLFPELCESEDEKIRKELILFFTKRDEFTKSEPFDGLSNKQIIAWLEKQKCNKTIKFSEEDEKTRLWIIHVLCECGYKFNDNGERENAFELLEKIKQIICSDSLEKQGEQKSVEWSEEDEDIINHLIKICSGAKNYNQFAGCSQNDITKYQNWLKSLKERYTWKPSEEQMQALFEAKLASTKNREYFLGLLYEDLKKL